MSKPDRSDASRGGEKLSAGLETFRLRSRVGGGRALDVGASHGGFTDVLLRAGANHVVAVDVGHGKMREPLRSDPRVTLHERTDFKKLPPRIEPGPFDFFAVDVAAVAARSMLRGIALRARPGAEGIVLVKPQFELPKALVPRGGVVESERLRRFAFDRFRKKALKLGFEVVARRDAPSAGAAGNREILVHLRFAGLPAAGASEGDAETDG